ncbi:MAG: DNA topoisomerase IV subunit A, partial [Desulfobulbaceae bacterium]|nr:DNA topoisomerase IV subunit A [Desulfobulbaceae bacterium]
EIQYLGTNKESRVRVYFVPNKRSKSNIVDFSFDEFLVKGVAAIGKRISTRVVRRFVELSSTQDVTAQPDPEPQPPLFPDPPKTES